ncbi:ABC transporter permease subunit [Paenibacillus rigui]|uniref:Alkanesulfonate transporter permease subunit n=1 Tax=Paenibacillus rigui TaxID=554312 RepID=A0A229UTV7_9BACL|nr:ABC transporter permease subunit [Paenibacillus rigui]OXM86763.1 alkanesulfonate transporter permease subunit [Paenibacillus rigui]
MKTATSLQRFYQFAPWIIPVTLILIWHGLTSTGVIPSSVLPEPLKVLSTFIVLLKNGELLTNIGVSAKRALSGFALGGGVGFLLGLMNGFSRTAEKLVDSSIQMIRNIPLFALIPLVIIWFGIEEPAKLLLVALGVFFPVYLNTFHGIRSIDPGLIEMGKVYGLKRFSLYRHIILPGALPSVLVGVRYALGVMWLTLIVAETVAAKSGIGYMANSAREFFQLDVIVLSIIIYALLGKLSDSIAKWLEKWWLQWNPNFAKR